MQSASGVLNSFIDNNDNNFNLGVSLEQGNNLLTDSQAENRAVVNFDTSLSDKWLLSGSLGIPVGGGSRINPTALGGDFELQYLFNEDGTFRAKIFNRENEIQQFLGDVQGYTQGVGLSYQIDFNSFRQLRQRFFAKKPKSQQGVVKDSLQTERAKDSLMRFSPKKTMR